MKDVGPTTSPPLLQQLELYSDLPGPPPWCQGGTERNFAQGGGPTEQKSTPPQLTPCAGLDQEIQISAPVQSETGPHPLTHLLPADLSCAHPQTTSRVRLVVPRPKPTAPQASWGRWHVLGTGSLEDSFKVPIQSPPGMKLGHPSLTPCVAIHF